MWLRQWSLRSLVIPLSAALAVSASLSVLSAQGPGSPLFEWNGRVNREVEITMRGREAWIQTAGRTDTRHAPVVSSALPRQDGTVRIQVANGRGDLTNERGDVGNQRGDAQVIQQPSRENDYTTIIRLRDRSGGADSYRVSAYWVSLASDNGSIMDARGNVRDRGNGRGYGRGRDAQDREDSRSGTEAVASAQNLLTWSGNVDDALEIRIQGNRISYRNLSGKGTSSVHAQLAGFGLPNSNVQLQVQQRSGRGEVLVTQQPNQSNGYTALIRIRDPRPSSGFYDFDVLMRNGYGNPR